MFSVWKAAPAGAGYQFTKMGEGLNRRAANVLRASIFNEAQFKKDQAFPIMYDEAGTPTLGWHK